MMDADLAALQAFRDAAKPVMPVLVKWAMAGALCIGALCGMMIGVTVGWFAGRSTKNKGDGSWIR
jgi:hypothetical protein